MAKTQKQNAKRKRRTAKRNAQLYKKNKKNGGGTDPRDTRFNVINHGTYKVYNFTETAKTEIKNEYNRLYDNWLRYKPISGTPSDYNNWKAVQPGNIDVINNIFNNIPDEDKSVAAYNIRGFLPMRNENENISSVSSVFRNPSR